MVRLHLRSGVVLEIDAPAADVSFDKDELGFVVKLKDPEHEGHSIAVAHVAREMYSHMLEDEHVRVVHA
jgi:hypothetical protein